MKILVAAVALLSLSMSGCGWMIADTCSMPGACDPATYIPAPEEEEDNTMVAVAIVGTAIISAVVIGMIVKGSRDEAPRAAAPSVTPAQVAVIAPAPSGDDRDQLLQRMYVQGYLSASSGKCEATVAIGNRLSTMSPSYHDRYVGDPTIATCLRR